MFKQMSLLPLVTGSKVLFGKKDWGENSGEWRFKQIAERV